MSADVEGTIAALREHFGVQTDAELARKLRVDKSTVYSWRSRGSVPARFVRILEGGSNQFSMTPPVHWGEHEIAAFELALFRFCRLHKDSDDISEYGSSVRLFSGDAFVQFLILMNFAQKDLVDRADGSSMSVGTTRAVLLHDDLQAGAASVERDKARIEQTYSSRVTNG